MHRLLTRQIKRYLGGLDAMPDTWQPFWQSFLNAVNDAYEQADVDRSMLERTVELNSQELLQLNSQIRAAIPDTFLRLDNDLTILDYKAGQGRHHYLQHSDPISKPLQQFLPIEIIHKLEYAIQEIQQQQVDEISLEYHLVSAQEITFYEVRLRPLFDHQCVAIIRDITERKQAEEDLRRSEIELRAKSQHLADALTNLQQTQAQLIQTEKMSSLGQLVAGIAHEINNPMNFISGNVNHLGHYIEDVLNLLELYQTHYPEPVAEILDEMESIDLKFVIEDLQSTQNSMRVGVDRINEIIRSLRIFSRLDEAEMKQVDIHTGIESTLLILKHRFQSDGKGYTVDLVKVYGDLPEVECYAGQLNQVFMNVIANALDALAEQSELALGRMPLPIGEGMMATSDSQPPLETDLLNTYASRVALATPSLPQPRITITTEVLSSERVCVRIADNGPGIPESVRAKLFDPFFTTKPVGQGTGLGLSISYQIVVDKHGGDLWCRSEPGQGTEFGIEIPIYQTRQTLE